ncbi:MAG TPA: fumarylacetoacetate hydrolase family protein [Kofleriaceae bacterium]|nr:fumarylacetoacetate hydrolase family protein [Kofleriaceae bacterium]
MDFVVPPPPVTSLAIDGSAARFPVRRVYCVGRNYADHAREMGGDPTREAPFFFTKPADAIVIENGDFPYPPATQNVHHEIELVIAIGKGGAGIAEASALDHVFGYAVGLDMTRRDLQDQAKKAGRPWDVSKGFDAAAPCGTIMPASKIGHPATGKIWLKVNGELRQNGDLAQLIWKVPEVVAYLSGLFTLAPGDLIYTGTPAGVGSVKRGDVMDGGIDGIGTVSARVV